MSTDILNAPWHAEECSDEHMENCPCIVAATIDGRIQYIADGETPELAARIIADHNRVIEVENELAELKAMNNPRLRCLLVKPARDRDLYVGWSNTCEMPAGAWTRDEALAYGFPPSRLDRADKQGTSSQIGDGGWDDSGFVAEQRGWLRRDRLGDYALLWLDGKEDSAFDLLEPFDGETEVRR